MRIIAGKWRGRVIQAPKGMQVRPTRDKIREAWMNIVQLKIPGARVLDLFAGSGALGLESLSRGALFTDFVEKDRASLNALRANIDVLGASDSIIHPTDAIAFAKRLGEDEYDLAFADPPYEGGYGATLAKLWMAKPFARLIGIEHSSRESLPSVTDESEYQSDTRKYGSTAITFYEQRSN